MKVVDIKNKKLTVGDFIVDGVFKTKIINWYLNDTDSRKWLENHCIKLEEEYKYNLSGDCRSRWNHLRCLLDGDVKDNLKETFFERYLFGINGNSCIKKIDFEYGPIRKSLNLIH